MRAEPMGHGGVLRLEPRVFRDDRGRFVETWHSERYAALGLAGPWAQDNVSVSRRGVLRGLHAQHPTAQGKMVTVLQGRVFDVAVDIRTGSPGFGTWVGAELDGESMAALWIPPGFAHGFLVLSDEAVFAYKCTAPYDPAAEFSVRWDDPRIGIRWPGGVAPLLSAKDAMAPMLDDLQRAGRLPIG